jgi:hypothetical protein
MRVLMGGKGRGGPAIIASAACLLVLAGILFPRGAAGEAPFPLVDTDIEWFRVRPVEVRWGADPFLSKAPADPQSAGGKPPPPAFLLTGVMLGGRVPAAVVDGEVVNPGSEIKGYRVERIEKDRIFLAGNAGTTLTVPLLPLYRLHQALP